MRAGTAARCVGKPVALENPHHADADTDANNAHPYRDRADARTDHAPFVDNGAQHRGEYSPSRSDFLRGEPGADPHADFQPRRHIGDDTREADDDAREADDGSTNTNAETNAN